MTVVELVSGSMVFKLPPITLLSKVTASPVGRNLRVGLRSRVMPKSNTWSWMSQVLTQYWDKAYTIVGSAFWKRASMMRLAKAAPEAMPLVRGVLSAIVAVPWHVLKLTS